MVEIRVTFNPTLDRLGRAFASVNIDSFMAGQINEIASKVMRFGKQLAPVDTGLMRSRITQPISALPTSLKAVVSTGVDYSIYVHEGTRYMRARPFLKRGAEFAQQNMAGNIGNRLDEEFTKVFKTL